MKDLKEDMRALWPFWALFFLFLWPLLVLKESFIGGDYFQQHLPWARFFYETWRHGRLPLWTDQMACGFPLLAEGQMAALYLIHMAAYRVLPFMAVYTWSIPFHVLVAGIGMVVYIRGLGCSRQAASIAATVFAFGSAYGGCFYNTGSLRTLCWLPWALYLLDQIRLPMPLARRAGFCAVLGLIFSQQWTAGFSQMALYAFGYYFLYEAIASWMRRDFTPMIWFSAALAAGTAAALPQILLTTELIGQSVRQGEGAAFALWGSVPPVASVSLLFPQWGNALRVSFYAGILPFFLIIAGFALRGRAFFNRHALLALIFFLLALGHFNPLYSWAIERLSLTSLRNPAKFLFFSVTSLAVLSAYGYDALIRARLEDRTGRCGKVLAAVAAVVLFLPVVGSGLMKAAGAFWGRYSQWYVERLAAFKGEDFKGAVYYLGVMGRFFEGLPGLFSYKNLLNLETIALTLASVWLIRAWIGRRLTEKHFFCGVSLLLMWDLLVFGLRLGTGFIGNAEPVRSLQPTAVQQRVIARAGTSAGPILEAVEDPRRELFAPNFNMWHGVRHAGGYSPLLLKNYYDLTRELGIVDASLGREAYSERLWRRERGVIDLIGTRLIHSDKALDWPGLRLVESGDGFFLYENDQALSDMTFFDRWRVIADPKERLAFLKSDAYDPRRLAVLEAPPGELPGDYRIVLLRLAVYPGWKLFVGGKPVRSFTVNHAFLGVALKDNQQGVLARYEPTGWRLTFALSVLAFSGMLLTSLVVILPRLVGRT